MNKLIQFFKDLFTFDASVLESDMGLKPIPLRVPTKSSRKLGDAEETLQTAFRLIREEYRRVNPGYTLVLTDVFRHPKKQKKLYDQGRSTPGKIVTYVDGVKKKGKHNYYPSKAIDVAVVKGATGKITWDVKLYKPLVKIVAKVSGMLGVKLVSGGSWKKLKDYPHVQVK